MRKEHWIILGIAVVAILWWLNNQNGGTGTLPLTPNVSMGILSPATIPGS